MDKIASRCPDCNAPLQKIKMYGGVYEYWCNVCGEPKQVSYGREAVRLAVRKTIKEAFDDMGHGDLDRTESFFPYQGRRSLKDVELEFLENPEDTAHLEYEEGSHRPLMLNNAMSSDLIRVIDVYLTMISGPIDAGVKSRLQTLRRRLVTIQMLTRGGTPDKMTEDVKPKEEE